VQGSLRTVRNSTVFTCVAVVLACNYFAFQAELFDAEYEANHAAPSTSSTITSSSLSWESFDKDNAPQAFVFDAGLRIFCVLVLPSEPALPFIPDPPFQIIRDKSPPSSSVTGIRL
jgi:hypothetical protein